MPYASNILSGEHARTSDILDSDELSLSFFENLVVQNYRVVHRGFRTIRRIKAQGILVFYGGIERIPVRVRLLQADTQWVFAQETTTCRGIESSPEVILSNLRIPLPRGELEAVPVGWSRLVGDAAKAVVINAIEDSARRTLCPSPNAC